MSARSSNSAGELRASLAQLARVGMCREPCAKARFHRATRTALAALADSLGIAQYRLYSHPQTPDLGGAVVFMSDALWVEVTPTPITAGHEVRFGTSIDVDAPRGRALDCASLDVFDTPDALVHRIQALLPCDQPASPHSDHPTPRTVTFLTRPHQSDFGSHYHV